MPPFTATILLAPSHRSALRFETLLHCLPAAFWRWGTCHCHCHTPHCIPFVPAIATPFTHTHHRAVPQCHKPPPLPSHLPPLFHAYILCFPFGLLDPVDCPHPFLTGYHATTCLPRLCLCYFTCPHLPPTYHHPQASPPPPHTGCIYTACTFPAFCHRDTALGLHTYLTFLPAHPGGWEETLPLHTCHILLASFLHTCLHFSSHLHRTVWTDG